MYSIKQESDGSIKAIYHETKAGLKTAKLECDMRTHATQRPHIVTDANGYKLYTALPHEVAKKDSVKREERWTKWLLFISLVAVISVFFVRR